MRYRRGRRRGVGRRGYGKKSSRRRATRIKRYGSSRGGIRL